MKAFFRKHFTRQNTAITFGLLLLAGVAILFAARFTQAAFYSSGGETWQYRQAITIDSSQVDSTLTDFPVYVDLSTLNAGFFSNVQSDGADIRITQSDGETEVAREVVTIDTANQTGELHFQAPTLDSGSDTTFYIYYGNPDASGYAPGDTYGRNAVWSNGYEAVWHMQENASAGENVIDSTGNGNTALPLGTNASKTNVDGAFSGQAINFDGSDDSFETGSADIAGDISLSYWANFDQPLDTAEVRFAVGVNYDGANTAWEFKTPGSEGAAGGTQFRFQSFNGSAQGVGVPQSAFEQNTWTHITGTCSAGNWQMYKNGDNLNGGNYGEEICAVASEETRYIGSQDGNTNNFDGQIDEMRLSSLERQSGWLSASHTNQDTPATFYSAGTQEEAGNDDASPTPDPMTFETPPDDAGPNAIDMEATTASDQDTPVEYFFQYQQCDAGGNTPPWYDANWSTRRSITIDSTQVDSTLTDFPVYVDTSSFGISNPGSIRVTQADGTTEVAREVVSGDELHFKADQLSASSDTTFYIYYGNSSASDYAETDTYGAQNVWTNNYAAVYHDAGTTDSTANNNDGTTNGGVTVGAADGPVGQATDFDGSDDFISVPDSTSLDISGDITWNAWLNPDTLDANTSLLGKQYSYQFYSFSNDGVDTLCHQIFNGSNYPVMCQGGNGVVNEGVLQHFSVTRNGDTISFFESSTLINRTTETTTGVTNNDDLQIANVPGNELFDGVMDEVRLAATGRSDSWIQSAYTNQDTPETFYTAGPAEAN